MAIISILAAIVLLIWLDQPGEEKSYDDTHIAN